MNSVALEIPDEPAEFPGWLEGHLVGPDLAALVAELEAVHRADPRVGAIRLDDVLGDLGDAVMTRGLAALPRDGLHRFLTRPRLLLDLQERVLVSGGEHWQRLIAGSPDLDAAVERGRLRLAAITRIGETNGGDRPSIVSIRPVAWYRRPWVVSLATAASVLAAVVGVERVRDRGVVVAKGWGWDRPGTLPEGVSSSAYLERLAEDAGDWFKQRPADAPSLARRIGEFRRGCSTLILAEHRPLSAEDRAWLVGKCREWAAKLDAYLRAVEAGDDPARVLGEADETVRKLIRVLQVHARESA